VVIATFEPNAEAVDLPYQQATRQVTGLTVLVPAYNEGASILDTIRSLQDQTRPVDRIIVIDDCSSLDGAGVVTETLPACDQYQLQGEAFSRAVRGEIALPYGVDDAIANMRAIDALFRSERTGQWEAVGRD
jgi:predicted dehydrogenase